MYDDSGTNSWVSVIITVQLQMYPRGRAGYCVTNLQSAIADSSAFKVCKHGMRSEISTALRAVV